MQAFNKYYPPDYTESQGSLNKLNGKHALGDRARKIDQGILITRFELPYNIWCGGCGNMIGMGVRYNSEKKKVGMYYSTPIFSFRCKCHLCSHWFEIRTDPQNTRYVVHAGAKQKNEEWDPAENGGHAIIEDKPLIELDAFATLEKQVTQKTRALTAAESLAALEDLQHSRWSDPYAASAALRSTFRGAKKVRLASERKAEETRERYGLGERVGVLDLRTPGGELLREESREWEEAKLERMRREAVSKGKRKADDQDRLEWKEDAARMGRDRVRNGNRPFAPASSKPATSSTRPPAASSSASSSRSSRRPASIKERSTVSSLAARILRNSAATSDPFQMGVAAAPSPSSSSTSATTTRLISSNAKIRGVILRK